MHTDHSLAPEARAAALRREADVVLDLLNLRALLEPLGPIHDTGSYFMDLMMYPDIDLSLPPTTPEKLLAVCTELSKLPIIKKLRFLRGGAGELKDGLYIKPEVEYGNWGRLWKIDIWSLPDAVLQAKRLEMDALKVRMTMAHRDIILETKHQLLTEEKRTPMFSGIFIYRAVINDGLGELQEIVEYLRANGIEV